MPVNTPSSEYERRSPDWRLIRKVIGGKRDVQDCGVEFLPCPAGMDPQGPAYLAYVARAGFFNGLGRAVQGLHGMVFRKEMELTLPPSMEWARESSTISGRPMDRVARWSMNEMLAPGRVGILSDAPRRLIAGDLSKAQVALLGLRPYLVTYRAEDILGTDFGVVNGRRQLTRVRLEERVFEPDPEDEFAGEVVERWRVLELVPRRVRPDGELEDAADPDDPRTVHVYQQREFRREEVEGGRARKQDAKIVQVGPPVVPRKADRQPWTRIPFELIDADGEPDDGDIAAPPMLDLGHKTVELYQVMADLRHGLFYAGFPTPCVSGLGKEEFDGLIGSPTAWVFPNPDSKAWYLTHGGEGLKDLREERAELRREIALLGARMLEPDRAQVEAAATAMIHRQGEISVLQSLAELLSAGLSRALMTLQEWMGAPGEAPVLKLNTDYVPTGATPQMVSAMAGLHAAGQITDEMWFNFLREGEVVSSGESLDVFIAFLQERGASNSMPEFEDEPPMVEAAE